MRRYKKPRKVAAALKYQTGDNAPKVTAVGYGEVAKKIEELAIKEKVPIYKDGVLAEALADLGVNTEIPPELYQAVAKIIAAVARLDRLQERE